MNTANYINKSIEIIKEHTIVLWITAFVSGINTLNFILVHFFEITIFFIPVAIVTFVSTLVMYGLYYEIIEDRYTSMKDIFSKYLFGFFVVSILINLPSIIISIIAIFVAEHKSQSIEGVLSIIFSIIFLYVVPFYYKDCRILFSISSGIKYLYFNINKSLPLITVVTIVYLTQMLLSTQLKGVEKYFRISKIKNF